MDTNTEKVDGFLAMVEGALLELQEALRAGLVTAGVTKSGPTAIGRALGLDKSIAWKVGRIAKASTPIEILDPLPGSQGARIIIAAFAKAGCPAQMTDHLRSAFDALEDTIRTHAGDRATARAMARAAVTRDEDNRVDESQRRDFFRIASQVWGAQARLQVKADFVAPGAKPNTYDFAGIEGLVDLLRLRPETAWRIARKRVTRNEDSREAHFRPLDPEVAENEAPIFSRYCTQPRPDITTIEESDGFTSFELQPGRIGKTGKTTCMLATYCEAFIKDQATSEQFHFIAGKHLRTPSELLVLDIFIHKSIPLVDSPIGELHAQLKMGPAFPATGKDHTLPTGSEVELLRSQPGSISLLEFPPYMTAIKDMLELAGKVYDPKIWRLEDFQGYRLRINYPPVPTIASIKFELQWPE